MQSGRLDLEWLRQRQHPLLVLMLVVLHFVAAVGPETASGRMLWLVSAGLFLLWQPFVGGDQQVKTSSVGVIFGVVLALVWQFGWGWLALWYGFLAALVGGKVVMARSLRQRWFYLIAFGYLVAAMLVWVSPRMMPESHALQLADLPMVHFVAAALFAGLVAAVPRSEAKRPAELHDFLASLLILLLLAVLLLGSIAQMTLLKIGYYEAMALTLLGAGAALLLLNWAWGPRPGFDGLGASLSGYLLRIGLDFDLWLKRQLDLAENEDDAGRYLERSLAGFSDLPWVAGGEWATASSSGRFGEPARHVTAFEYHGVSIRLFTPYAWSASLIWQASLLLNLVVELHDAKVRETRLRQMEYLQAVHETGSRLTHDIKNLLQSLEGLCYAAERSAPEDARRLADLMRRQLPAIGQRLRVTLDKLQHPQDNVDLPVAASLWWEGLKRRHPGGEFHFVEPAAAIEARIPSHLFDSVADNLMANAAYKRQVDAAIRIFVSLAEPEAGIVCLAVEDSGAPIPAELARTLLVAPAPSASGFGIGLYQAARQARETGCELRLADNRDGSVRFELLSATAAARGGG